MCANAQVIARYSALTKKRVICQPDGDPLTWWCENKQPFPTIAHFARAAFVRVMGILANGASFLEDRSSFNK
ncbi:hypothetical protein DPMN_135144 [Dreissena polymorpha]|uniref:HAT C-terminal dimerisation domain-containing protein n=1 Tax=Dreissena polymorpha TaxID=45954 RepID=A0A9D4G0Z5_DREPO|nr:hypothetical protein DPMN_135144 [Dreissena polymorpha]